MKVIAWYTLNMKSGAYEHTQSEIEIPVWNGPAILLLDLDAFFASVEQLDHPAWRGKPVIVGGDAERRGVVSTCSYEARRYGVRSAMSSSLARELCPDAIWTRGRHERYRAVSKLVMDLLYDETPYVQQVSIDEAFADISPTRTNRENPVIVASRVQRRVKEIGVTCSIGLGTSKTVAKIASDMDKPNGLTVVYPGSEENFLSPLPVRSLSGIGPSAEKKLIACGIRTLGDLAQADEGLLKRIFGKNALRMRDRACGREVSVVAADHDVKSISNEVTFPSDLSTREEIDAALGSIAAKVGRRLRKQGLACRSLGIKIRYSDWTTRTVQRQLASSCDDEIVFTPMLLEMMDEIWRLGMKVRLLGVVATGFDSMRYEQAPLFGEELQEHCSSERRSRDKGRPEAYNDEHKRRSLLSATDSLKDRFGENAIRFGRELRNDDSPSMTS